MVSILLATVPAPRQASKFLRAFIVHTAVLLLSNLICTSKSAYLVTQAAVGHKPILLLKRLDRTLGQLFHLINCLHLVVKAVLLLFTLVLEHYGLLMLAMVFYGCLSGIEVLIGNVKTVDGSSVGWGVSSSAIWTARRALRLFTSRVVS